MNPPVDLLQQAITHHQAGQLAEAEALYRKVLEATPNHPVALHLIGLIAYQVGQFPVALQLIDSALAISPDYADAHANRGNTLHALHQYQDAVDSYDSAIRLNPSFPEAHNNRGNALYALEQYEAALKSCHRAIALRPDYPEAHNNRGNALQALQQYQAALESYNQAILLKPDYADAYSNRGNALQAINLANVDHAKRDSTGRDLVFYCGLTTEIWNPHIAATQGIGGSEEAVLWLSRLLHRRGWNVTVYANCGPDEHIYDGVTWKAYWMWNPHDKQNVTILWRHPNLADHDINSDKIVLDLHDVIPESELSPIRLRKIHTIFVKSKFHRSLFPKLPDEKFAIVPNGIDTTLFDTSAPRDPLLLINTSSADRSLEAFLDCFDQIKQQVPGAEAHWAYGWGVWDAVHASNSAKMQWKADMQQRMQQLGIVERGRISPTEIAALYHQANIFVYPSEMAEIDCISLSKAMAAGAIPITTDFAAMGEKSHHGGIFIRSKKTKDNWALPHQFHFEITDPQQKSQFIHEAVNLLRNPPAEAARESMRTSARLAFDWNTIADTWHHALSENLHQPSALADYDRAILLNPHHAEAHNNRGSALHGLLQFEAALANFDQAILLKPDYADAHANRGNVLLALKQYPAALQAFDHALRLQPGYPYLRGMRLYLKRLLCDWTNTADELHAIETAITAGEKVALPFAMLALSPSPAIQKQAAEIYVRDKHPPLNTTPIPSHPGHGKIRIGYFSADFYNHATSYLMAELFERHDHTKFEIIGFSFGPNERDQMHRRVSSAMDRFLDVRSLPDHAIAQLSRGLEVDIAVDLKGFTRDHRAGIFSHRAAPIQVNYLGYPGTMAAPYIDYLIADPTLIPESRQPHYSEKIIYLPDTYQPTDSHRELSTDPITRAEQGLPETAFVFCCFNNTYKITPATFDLWMRILSRVDNSVLWLLEENPAAVGNLKNEAERRGISPERLIFAKPLPQDKHLARHRLADLFLDTTPYNAHTTASDALWSRLPVLTRIGETLAGRVAASLLRAIDLPELVTTTDAAYEDLAVTLAHTPHRLHAIRQRLEHNRVTTPLFDTATFTRHLEAAYTAIHALHYANLSPAHINIFRIPR